MHHSPHFGLIDQLAARGTGSPLAPERVGRIPPILNWPTANSCSLALLRSTQNCAVKGLTTTFTPTSAQYVLYIAGEVDWEHGESLGYTAEKIATLKRYEEKGGYRVIPAQYSQNTFGVVYFNYSQKDPVLREIFQDKRFRIALSIAMDRDEVNEIIFRGAYFPGQLRPDVGSRYDNTLPQFYHYTQYDPQLANRLLDAIGLQWDKDHKVRLRPDGKPLNLVV
ncbi:MAG: hypothetical protein GH145_00350, partial [Firmicutes bacterium]|nr:hypothetical protein [Bacillota bacterium]